jgi:hypothetical protein
VRVCSLRRPACNAHAPCCHCGLPGSTTLFHIISQRARFFKNVIEHKICVLIFSTTFVRNIWELSEILARIYVGLHVRSPLFLADFNENWIFLTDFRKIFKYQIQWNSFSGRGVGPCGQTDGRTDGLTKPIVAFRNFASAPKNGRNVELKAGRMWKRKWIHVFQVRARGAS